MNINKLALYTGALVAGLGVVGLISGDGRMAGVMNIDLMLDGARVALGALLIYASMKSANTARTAFMAFGAAYIGMFILGLLSPTLFGLLPGGLGLVDNILHIGGGLMGVYLGMKVSKNVAHA